PEAVALDDHAGQRLQVADAVPLAESAERLLARPPAAQLERHRRELLAERVLHRRPFLADAGDRGVQAEARLEADDHEIERVGEDDGDLPDPSVAHRPETRVQDTVGAEP